MVSVEREMEQTSSLSHVSSEVDDGFGNKESSSSSSSSISHDVLNVDGADLSLLMNGKDDEDTVDNELHASDVIINDNKNILHENSDVGVGGDDVVVDDTEKDVDEKKKNVNEKMSDEEYEEYLTLEFANMKSGPNDKVTVEAFVQCPDIKDCLEDSLFSMDELMAVIRDDNPLLEDMDFEWFCKIRIAIDNFLDSQYDQERLIDTSDMLPRTDEEISNDSIDLYQDLIAAMFLKSFLQG